MPITPFHFGPGAAMRAVAPRHVSFLAFCAANVVIDVESLYNLVHRRSSVHAFFHTYVGATLVVAAVGVLFVAARALATRVRRPDLLRWRGLTSRRVVVGAALGAYSHVVLDSVMHADIRPLAPFSPANALLGVISLRTLHLACLALGLLGVAGAAFRWLSAEE